MNLFFPKNPFRINFFPRQGLSNFSFLGSASQIFFPGECLSNFFFPGEGPPIFFFDFFRPQIITGRPLRSNVMYGGPQIPSSSNIAFTGLVRLMGNGY